MKTLEKQIDDLASRCFAIEEQLPSFNPFRSKTPEQELRQDLYGIRCSIMSLSLYAKMVDEAKERK